MRITLKLLEAPVVTMMSSAKLSVVLIGQCSKEFSDLTESISYN